MACVYYIYILSAKAVCGECVVTCVAVSWTSWPFAAGLMCHVWLVGV